MKDFLKENLIKASKYLVLDLVLIHQGFFLLGMDKPTRKPYIKILETKFLEINPKESETTLENIKNYIEIRAQRSYSGEVGEIPKEILNLIDELSFEHILTFLPLDVRIFVEMLQTQEVSPYFPLFYSKLPLFIVENIDYYEFDDFCFFYLILITYSGGLDYNYKFWENMHTIKLHIKFISLRRGFKIDLNSHFYKLLNHINLAEFFEGGEL